MDEWNLVKLVATNLDRLDMTKAVLLVGFALLLLHMREQRAMRKQQGAAVVKMVDVSAETQRALVDALTKSATEKPAARRVPRRR